MTAEDVLEIVTALEKAGVAVWLDGGWAVDALLGSQTRQHDDLDVVVDLGKVDAIERELGRRGFAVAVDELPTRLEMKDERGRCIDLHTVTFDEEGGGTQMQQSGKVFRYPPECFCGMGEVGGQTVRCLAAEVQAECHYGYQPDEKDRHDMRLLHRHFGIALRAPYDKD
jgi:lincosamide nucleotidyltransferase A/C/D/E